MRGNKSILRIRKVQVIILAAVILVVGGYSSMILYQFLQGHLYVSPGSPFRMAENATAYVPGTDFSLTLRDIIYMPLAEGVRGIWSGKGASIILKNDGDITTTSLSLERSRFGNYGYMVTLLNVTEEWAEFLLEES